mmetsp:Transcript_8160/g.34649  ORF Transcript_8160/g.34649 Transcript_8160/m.34649 type:complete len:243 (+) Transcript_8160:1168-1896(+)
MVDCTPVPTAMSRCMVFGSRFCIIFAVCSACSSVMFMPDALDISLSCSGEMFFIMSDIAACIAGSFIFSAILDIASAEGAPPDAGSNPMSFISAAIFIMPSIASGFMFFIIDAACFAIFGSICGMPAPPGIDAVIASSCSSVMFSIISDALLMKSGSFIASAALAIVSGPKPIAFPAEEGPADTSNSGVSPSSASPLEMRSATARSSSAATVSSPGASFTARLRSATASRYAFLCRYACPRR